MILEVKNVNFNYGRRQVLRDVNLSIKEGDYLGIIGENGGGKTTLLKLIIGLLPAQKGSIKLCGKQIDKFNDWHKVGYVAQRATAFDQQFPASVEEIVSLGLKKPGLFIKRNRDEIIEALKKVDMHKFLKAKIGELSGGQQQRVLIARALISNPRIVFLDEPTTGVDLKSQERFYGMLGKLNKEGITIVIVSHDISYITKYVGKVAYVNQTLIFHGTHKQFCSSHVVDKMLGHEKHVICQDRLLL